MIPASGNTRENSPSTRRNTSFLLDEGHLDIDLGELGLAVRAQILVAEAPRELHVALEAADHQDLLEQLRRLRQGVETAVVQAARHQVVAGPLRRRAREHRRFDVDETLLAEVAQAFDREVGAQPEVALQGLTAQIEEPVLEARLLARVLGSFHHERHRLGTRQDPPPPDLHLDLAGGHLRVDLVRIAAHDLALDLDDVLEPRGLQGPAVSGVLSGWTTACTTPLRSRTSRKITPP